MRYLLDTNIIIRSAESESGISKKLLQTLTRPGAEVFYSHVSLWEITIKTQIGRLDLKLSLQDLRYSLQDKSKELPILFSHIEELQNQPLHHRDPFDRLLISQAKAENLTLVTSDRNFSKYKVKLLISD